MTKTLSELIADCAKAICHDIHEGHIPATAYNDHEAARAHIVAIITPIWFRLLLACEAEQQA